MTEELLSLMMGGIFGAAIVYIWHLFVIRNLENQLWQSEVSGIQQGVNIAEKYNLTKTNKKKTNKKKTNKKKTKN